MLVSEIATRVKRQFGDEAGAQITDADIIRWCNDAQREIAASNDLLQVIATTAVVAGTDQYTLPTDILTLRNVRYAGVKLRFLTPEESTTLIGTDTTTIGTPTHYSIFANKIDLFPAPDTTSATNLQLYYTRQPVDVTVVGDTPELPLKYHNRIVEYCIAQAYELDDNYESYEKKMKVFNDGVDKLKGTAEWADQDVYPSISVGVSDFGDMGDSFYA